MDLLRSSTLRERTIWGALITLGLCFLALLFGPKIGFKFGWGFGVFCFTNAALTVARVHGRDFFKIFAVDYSEPNQVVPGDEQIVYSLCDASLSFAFAYVVNAAFCGGAITPFWPLSGLVVTGVSVIALMYFIPHSFGSWKATIKKR